MGALPVEFMLANQLQFQEFHGRLRRAPFPLFLSAGASPSAAGPFSIVKGDVKALEREAGVIYGRSWTRERESGVIYKGFWLRGRESGIN